MTVRNWSNSAGGIWSVAGNWVGSAQPGTNDSVSFASGTYTTIIDTGFLPGGTPVFSDINLNAPGVTLDIQRSITVGQIDGALSSNGVPSSSGLIEIGNGALLTYNPAAGSLVNTTNGNPNVGLYVKGDGVGNAGTLLVGGSLDTGATVIADGVNFDATGGIVDSSAILVLKNGATWAAQSTETFDVGTVKLAGGGVADLEALRSGALLNQGFSSTDQQVIMSGANNTLILPNTSDAKALTITGFGLTDKIEIAGVGNVASATYSAGILHFYAGLNGAGSNIANLTGVKLAAGEPATLGSDQFLIGTDQTGTFVQLVACFTAGTEIQTPDGPARVEELGQGDLVMAAAPDGTLMPRRVIWAGHRRIDLKRHPDPLKAAPVRIRQNAFAENVPHRDLILSPDHAIFVDGGLVPAKLLVNGSTIVRETPDIVEYYHIECETHSILLAEGLTVESYLDTGNRGMFDDAEGGLTLHPLFDVDAAAKCWDDACAPLNTHPDTVEPVWRRIAARAAALGWTTSPAHSSTADPKVHLEANGRKIWPVVGENGRHIFVLPRNPAEVILRSRFTCPAAERPWHDDPRDLGVAVATITLRGDKGLQVISADHPALERGWWHAENDAGRRWRWSNGAGVIRIPEGVRSIEIDIMPAAEYPLDLPGGGARQAA